MIAEDKKYLDKSGLERVGVYINSKFNDCVTKCEYVTYDRLLYLRNTGSLKPGQYYRLNDYVCSAQGDGVSFERHNFDIIIQALSETTLNERCIVDHYSTLESDYFHDSKLYMWDVWYCIDNDKNRFEWADENGRGVIYRMIDEYGNDCPYDFKNIKFDGKYTFDNVGVDGSMTGYYHDIVIDKYTTDGKQKLNNIVFNGGGYCVEFMNDCHNIKINTTLTYSEFGYNINNYNIDTIRKVNDNCIIYIRYNSFGKIVTYCEADLINF